MVPGDVLEERRRRPLKENPKAGRMPICMGLKAFLGCRAFSFKTGEILYEPGQLVTLNGQGVKCWLETGWERRQGTKKVKGRDPSCSWSLERPRAWT